MFAPARSVGFSPNGRQAIAGLTDGTVCLWEVDTGQCKRTFKGHTAAVRSVAFGPDGRHALTGSDDETTILWEVTTAQRQKTFKAHTGPLLSRSFSATRSSVL